MVFAWGTCRYGKNIWTLSAVSLHKYLRLQCPEWSYPIWLYYLASTFWLSFGIRTCYVHEWRNEVKTVETRKIIVTKQRETSQVLTPKLTRHFLYVQQDSESSKVIEEPKKTEGEVLLEEAVKVHANREKPSQKVVYLSHALFEVVFTYAAETTLILCGFPFSIINFYQTVICIVNFFLSLFLEFL